MTAIITQTRFGPMLVPPYDVYLSQAMIRLGEYAPAEFDTWAPYIPEGGAVVDVGANIGCHVLPFAAAVGPLGTVIAVEPQFMLHAMLCGTVALNSLSNVRVRWCALGADAGVVVIPPIDYGRQGNFGSLELGDPTPKKGEPVPLVALDRWELDKLDFLKIDVEGMELDVLRGAGQTIKRLRPVIAAEADREAKVPALLEWFKSHDYATWWHRPPLGVLWPDVVSVNLLGIPRERLAPVDATDYATGVEGLDYLPEPTGDVAPVDESL